jgi:ElaB/YqjD/DUF883 family membrane-anchored ribosome-binding protein
MSAMSATQKEELVGDLNAVIQDTEELLDVTSNQASESTTALRERARLRLERAKSSLQDLQHVAIDKAKATGRMTDDYVRDRPWQSVGVAAGIGLLLGILISRR